MADFKVTPNVLLSSQTELNALQSKLLTYESEISKICNQLNFKIAARESIRRKLNNIADNVGTCAQYVHNMSDAVGTISEKYSKSEKTIKTNGNFAYALGEVDINPALAQIVGPGGQASYDESRLFSLLATVLGKFGILGSFANAFINAGILDVPGVLKGLADATGGIFDMVAEPDWAKLIGFNEADKLGFYDKFAKDFDEFADFSTGAKAGKAFAKWAGVGAEALDNGLEYYEKVENGEMSAGEAVASTAINTGYDVLIDTAAMAGITALAATCGVAAPAVVVGIGAAFVVWGADCLVSNFTDYDSLGEAMTAWTVDAFEAVSDAVSDTVDAIAEGVSTAWNGICDFFNIPQPASAGGGGGGGGASGGR